MVVYSRQKSWGQWQPASLDDAPPVVDDDGQFRVCDTFAEAFGMARELNSAWIASKSPQSPAHWAVVGCVEPDTPDTTALRIASPLSFRVAEVRVQAGWNPRHLLDVPDCRWRLRFADGHDLTAYSSLEAALAEAISINESTHVGGATPVRSWNIVIALENSPIFEHLEYRCWRPNDGILSRESTRRIHVFDRATWPVPKGVQMEFQLAGPHEKRGRRPRAKGSPASIERRR